MAEGDFKKSDGDILYASEVNVFHNGLGQSFLNSTQQWFNTAYKEGGDTSSWESNLHGDGVPQWKNIDLNTFQSDNADVAYNLKYDSTNDYYYALDLSSASLVYVDIYATSVSIASLTDAANDLHCVKIGDGVWRVYCWKEANEQQNIKRILNKMFEGLADAATDPNGVTALTQLRTSYSSYQDTRMYWLYTNTNNDVTERTAAWTFSSSANFTVQSVYIAVSADLGGARGEIEAPTGSVIYTEHCGSGSSVEDNRFTNDAGTAVVAETTADWIHKGIHATGDSTIHGIIITDDGETLSLSSSDQQVTKTTGPFDFSATAPDTATYPLTSHTLILKTTAAATVEHGASSVNYDIDGTSSIAVSLSADSGANYETSITNGKIYKFANTGTGFWRRYVITRTDNSVTDYISEECGWYDQADL